MNPSTKEYWVGWEAHVITTKPKTKQCSTCPNIIIYFYKNKRFCRNCAIQKKQIAVYRWRERKTPLLHEQVEGSGESAKVAKF